MVRIGAGSWIGSGAVVMADVGRDSVVAAGAVVTEATARPGSSRLACLRASYASAAPVIGPAREAAVSHPPVAVRAEPGGSHPRLSPAEGARPVCGGHARLARPRRGGSGPRRGPRDIVHEVHAVRVTPRRNKLRALSALATARPLTHVLLDGPAPDRDGRRRGAASGRRWSSRSAREWRGWRAGPLFEGIPLCTTWWTWTRPSGRRWRGGALAAVGHLRARVANAAPVRSRGDAAGPATFVVNQRERDLCSGIAPEAPVSALAKGVDAASFRRPGRRPIGPRSSSPACSTTAPTRRRRSG